MDPAAILEQVLRLKLCWATFPSLMLPIWYKHLRMLFCHKVYHVLKSFSIDGFDVNVLQLNKKLNLHALSFFHFSCCSVSLPSNFYALNEHFYLNFIHTAYIYCIYCTFTYILYNKYTIYTAFLALVLSLYTYVR